MTGPCGRVQYTALQVTVLCKINGKEFFVLHFRSWNSTEWFLSLEVDTYIDLKSTKNGLWEDFDFRDMKMEKLNFFVFDWWLRITEIVENFLVFKFGGEEASPWAGVVVACFMAPHHIPSWSPGDGWGCPGDAGGRFGDVPKDPQASPNGPQQVPTHPQTQTIPSLRSMVIKNLSKKVDKWSGTEKGSRPLF